MKWIRITALFLLAVGLIVQNNLSTKKDVRESIGSNIGSEKPESIIERNDLLLPDQKLFPPKQLYIENRNGVKKIRFDTTFANIGKGPLELIGELNADTGKTIATQIIQKTDGGKESMVVGEFVFHPGHSHWHIEKYAEFQLWHYNNIGIPTELVASTDKFSFCIWDEHVYDLGLENAPKIRQYPRCPNNIQGNSVGWADTYKASLEGQEIDITGVEDGKYLIRSRVNAENKIIESDYTNNFAFLFVEIIGNRITILGNP